MKKLSLCALAIMSMNSYAVEHINQKEWTTGQGATGSLQIVEEKITPLSESEKKNLSYNLTAATKAYYGRVNVNVALQGNHGVEFYNATNQTKRYDVTLYLCVLDRNCYNNTYSISLNSGYKYQLRTNSLLNYVSKEFGNFSLQAGTRISGAEYGLAYDTKPLNIEP